MAGYKWYDNQAVTLRATEVAASSVDTSAMHFRDTWVMGTSYDTGAVVTQNGHTYVCTSPHTAGAGTLYGSGTSAGSGNRQVTLPSGAVAGDLFAGVGSIYDFGSNTGPVPAGATAIAKYMNSAASHATFSYYLTSTDITNGYVTVPGSGQIAVAGYFIHGGVYGTGVLGSAGNNAPFTPTVYPAFGLHFGAGYNADALPNVGHLASLTTITASGNVVNAVAVAAASESVSTGTVTTIAIPTFDNSISAECVATMIILPAPDSTKFRLLN